MKTAAIIVIPAVALALVGALCLGLAPARPSKVPALQMRPVAGAVAASAPSTFDGLPADAFAERIHALGRAVPEKEQAALAAWIAGPKPAPFSEETWLYLVNEVMDCFARQSHPLASWTGVLVGIAGGEGNDPGHRDYALQHLVDRIQPANVGETFESDPEKRRAILATMTAAAGELEQDFSGTAVLGLHLVLAERERSERIREPASRLALPFAAEDLRPLAVRLATSPESTDAARSAALQVCAERGFAEMLPAAREIAADPSRIAILRASAVAAIGQLGDPEDAALLEKLKRQGGSKLLKAVQPALKKIKQRAALAAATTKE